MKQMRRKYDAGQVKNVAGNIKLYQEICYKVAV